MIPATPDFSLAKANLSHSAISDAALDEVVDPAKPNGFSKSLGALDSADSATAPFEAVATDQLLANQGFAPETMGWFGFEIGTFGHASKDGAFVQEQGHQVASAFPALPVGAGPYPLLSNDAVSDDGSMIVAPSPDAAKQTGDGTAEQGFIQRTSSPDPDHQPATPHFQNPTAGAADTEPLTDTPIAPDQMTINAAPEGLQSPKGESSSVGTPKIHTLEHLALPTAPPRPVADGSASHGINLRAQVQPDSLPLPMQITADETIRLTVFRHHVTVQESSFHLGVAQNAHAVGFAHGATGASIAPIIAALGVPLSLPVAKPAAADGASQSALGAAEFTADLDIEPANPPQKNDRQIASMALGAPQAVFTGTITAIEVSNIDLVPTESPPSVLPAVLAGPTMVSVAAGGAGTAALPQAMPAQITQQAIVALTPLPIDQPARIELMLAPETLGRLHFDMRPEGSAMAITLSAERPETLELMRRHLPELLAELKQAGVQAGSMSFGSWSEGRSTPEQHSGNPPDDAIMANLAPPTVLSPPRPLPHGGAGLDLRF